MAIFRGVGGSGSSSDNSFLQEVTAQAQAAEASATSAANSLAAIQETEVTSASFDTSDGVLTLTKTGGATVTADLDGRFLTSYTETNDLSSAVTWVNVPNAYITEGSVTQHQAALTITESQISDLQSYLTSYTEANNLTTAVTWANVPDANITESSVTQHLTATNVANAGALMDSEVTNLAQVKAFDSSDYATAAQGSTADSALQNLVEDTTPQLGGDLNAETNDILNVGNISGAQLTIGTSGFSTLSDINLNSQDITSVGNISATGNLVTTSGSITTNSGNITANSGNIITGGNITVGGTVDGRDISTDGSRLDTIPYHHVSEVRLAGASSYLYLTTSDQDLGQYQYIYHQATSEDACRYVDIEWSTYWNYTSSVNDTRLTLQLTVPSGATTHTLGTVTEISTSGPYSIRASGEKWYYVSGDKTHLFTQFGRVSQSSTGGAVEHIIRASQYNPNENRTYFCSTSSLSAMSTGDTAYWHPYAWESAGTTLTLSYDITERYRSGIDRNKVSFKLAFTDALLTLQIKIKELATGDTAQVRDSIAKLTSIGL